MHRCMRYRFLFLSITLSACQTMAIQDLSSDEGKDRIKLYYEENRWEEVIHDIDAYKTRYPYVAFSTEARFFQADAYYQSQKYVEALDAYQEFIRLSPKNQKVSDAIFRIAECWEKQSSEDSHRDQSITLIAYDAYEAFQESYPESVLAKEARVRMNKLQSRILNHYNQISEFYYGKNKIYSSFIYDVKILEQGKSHKNIWKQAKVRVQKALKSMDTCKDHYVCPGQSTLVEKARSLLKTN
jgi:outer membrane assembly lipoprotein YfiO